MPNPLAFPGVSDVDQSVTDLDDRGIRELAAGFLLQRQRSEPFPTIVRNCYVDGTAGRAALIKDQQRPAIGQDHAVDGAVWCGRGFVFSRKAIAKLWAGSRRTPCRR